MQQHFPNQQEFQQDFDFNSATLLGAGTFGKVYKAKSLKSLPSGNYALKIIETNRYLQFPSSESAYQVAIQELNLNQIINYHENVIRLYKVYSWVEYAPFKKFVLVLVMELAVGSFKNELEDRRVKKQRYDDAQIINIMNQSLKTFHFLATEKHLYHRDIKPENMLLTSKTPLIVKIADFGAGKENFNQQIMMNTLVGTPLFLSPKLYMAYTINHPGKVNHHLEKSDVFSLGLTFLQLILLLNDRELMSLNNPIIYDDKGDAIDCSDKPAQLATCPGWIKLQALINQIQNPHIKATIYGMTQFSQVNRFTWLEALKTLNPDYQETLPSEQVVVQKQAPINAQAIKTFQNNTIQIKYYGSITDQSKHDGIITAGQQILSYSNEGVRIIKLTGESEQLYDQGVRFLVFMPIHTVAIGINNHDQIFGINIKNKQFYQKTIQNFDPSTITIMKHMRKELCILGTKKGDLYILAFDSDPPQIIKQFKEHESSIVDITYDDEFKVVFTAHQDGMITLKSLAQQQRYLIQYSSNQLQLEKPAKQLHILSAEYLVALLPTQIIILHTFEGSLEIIVKIQTNVIPKAIAHSAPHVLWVSDSYLGAFNYQTRIVASQVPDDLVCSTIKQAKHIVVSDQNTFIASDGLELHKYAVMKKISQKNACNNCQLQ